MSEISATWVIGNALCGTLAVSLLTLEAVRVQQWLQLFKKEAEVARERDGDLRYWPVLDLRSHWTWDGMRATTYVDLGEWHAGMDWDSPNLVPDRETTIGEFTFNMKYKVDEITQGAKNGILYSMQGWNYFTNSGVSGYSDDIFLMDSDGNPHVLFRDTSFDD